VANSSFASAANRTAGFTLIEVMITVAIIAILAAIALPNYSAYVMRSKIIDATTKLGDLRSDMEKSFMDNRSYLDPLGGQCAVIASGKKASYNADPSANFQVDCPAVTATTYTLTATGMAARGMGGFTFTINEANVKTTAGVPAGWALPVPNLCWVTKKDGSCG
jgi:type IV pilus assembly protein PilE